MNAQEGHHSKIEQLEIGTLQHSNNRTERYSHSLSPHSKTNVKDDTDFPYRNNNTALNDQCDDLCYHVKNGFLLIINNITFRDRVSPRYNADEDVKKAKSFFASVSFEIEEYVDLTADEMENVFIRVANRAELAQYDCLTVLVSSHGGKDGILGVDSKTLSVSSVINIFKLKTCAFSCKKPKVFLVQACRGENEDSGCITRDGGSNYTEAHPLKTIPTDANIFIAYATTEGRKAHSTIYPPFVMDERVSNGSWFISNLIEILKVYSKTEDLSTMMIRVNKAMTEIGDNFGKKQISSQVSQLTYKLYFTANN